MTVETWQSLPVKKTVKKISTIDKKIKQKEALPEGNFPVIDQGQDFIAGYFNDQSKVIDVGPVIVFGDHTKAIKYVDFPFVPGADGTKVLQPDPELFIPKLFYYFLNCIKFPDKGYARHYQHLEKEFINVPPLEEQEQIIAKIEKLFTDIDNTTNDLNKIPKLIDMLYQSRLKNIFLGTEQANEVFNIDELYKQIMNYKKQAPNVKRLNLDIIQDNTLPDLKDRGFWCSIDLLASNAKHAIKAGPFGSSLKKSMYSTTGYKIYGQEQVIRQQYDYGDYYIPEDKYQELISNSVGGGDVLISLVGTIGKVLVLPENTEHGIINPRLVKITFNEDHFLPHLFKYYFESQFVKTIYKLKTHGATMDVLNLGIIRTIPIPVFPITKQRAMLASIEELEIEIENLRRELTNYEKNNETIKLSILLKAFGGELV